MCSVHVMTIIWLLLIEWGICSYSRRIHKCTRWATTLTKMRRYQGLMFMGILLWSLQQRGYSNISTWKSNSIKWHVRSRQKKPFPVQPISYKLTQMYFLTIKYRKISHKEAKTLKDKCKVLAKKLGMIVKVVIV